MTKDRFLKEEEEKQRAERSQFIKSITTGLHYNRKTMDPVEVPDRPPEIEPWSQLSRDPKQLVNQTFNWSLKHCYTFTDYRGRHRMGQFESVIVPCHESLMLVLEKYQHCVSQPMENRYLLDTVLSPALTSLLKESSGSAGIETSQSSRPQFLASTSSHLSFLSSVVPPLGG